MELSSVLNQRWRELREWQQEAILTIRKAFTFDDVECDRAKLTPVLDTSFVLHVDENGYGFYSGVLTDGSFDSVEDSWIKAYPDAKTRQIVVSKRINGKMTKTRLNTFVTVHQLKPNPEEALRREIIDFLARAKLKEKPIDW